MSKLVYTLKNKEFTVAVKAASWEYNCGVIVEVRKAGKSYIHPTSIPCFTGNARKVRRLARTIKNRVMMCQFEQWLFG